LENIARISYSVFTRRTQIEKSPRPVISNVVSKLKDFPRSQAVTLHCKSRKSLSRKWCKIATLTVTAADRKWYKWPIE